MEQYAHKNEVLQTRVGGLGGSDSAMLARIVSMGYVPQSAYKRMAICKGLIASEEHASNAAMRYGDYIENEIYNHLSHGNTAYQSNPLWVSKKFSKKNCRLFAHPDIVLVDEEKTTIYCYEVKTTRYSVSDTKTNYRTQLYTEWMLGKEKAAELGYKWKIKLYLVHYDTNGLNVDEMPEFDTERLSVNEVRFTSQVFDIEKGMSIVNQFLETFDYYTEEEEVNAEYLPDNIKCQFNDVAMFVREIKEREVKIEAFKQRLYDFMFKKGIKKVSCDDFAFTLILPSESSSVDYKKFFEEEYAAKYPRKAARAKEKYKKTTNKKGYVNIRVNNNNNN